MESRVWLRNSLHRVTIILFFLKGLYGRVCAKNQRVHNNVFVFQTGGISSRQGTKRLGLATILFRFPFDNFLCHLLLCIGATLAQRRSLRWCWRRRECELRLRSHSLHQSTWMGCFLWGMQKQLPVNWFGLVVSRTAKTSRQACVSYFQCSHIDVSSIRQSSSLGSSLWTQTALEYRNSTKMFQSNESKINWWEHSSST